METTEECAKILRLRLERLYKEVATTEKNLRILEKEIDGQKPKISVKCELSNDEITRYSRQLILPNFGATAQMMLRESSFLVVGVGGLGCPVAQYLAAAGAGTIGLVDHDSVELTNLHRQILHITARIGKTKVDSAEPRLREMNPDVTIVKHHDVLNSRTVMDTLREYDVILDCSDNMPTRYLLNDACVLTRKPLVSGSALQWDGQLTVYNHGPSGPCYRCLFPVPPPRTTVNSCGDAGVMGAVTGVIGTMQALEAIKVATEAGDTLAGRLLIFDGLRSNFRTIKLRTRRLNCEVCSSSRIITNPIDYEQFCGMEINEPAEQPLRLLADDQRLRVDEYVKSIADKPHMLVDVRPQLEFQICKLAHAVNVPLPEVLNDTFAANFAAELADEKLPIILICRRGNDSQRAAEHLSVKFPQRYIRDVIGGYFYWRRLIDPEFPFY